MLQKQTFKSYPSLLFLFQKHSDIVKLGHSLTSDCISLDYAHTGDVERASPFAR